MSSSPTAELQLKHYHLPCKLFKRWKELLSQYTNASYDEVNKGGGGSSFRAVMCGGGVLRCRNYYATSFMKVLALLSVTLYNYIDFFPILPPNRKLLTISVGLLRTF